MSFVQNVLLGLVAGEADRAATFHLAGQKKIDLTDCDHFIAIYTNLTAP